MHNEKSHPERLYQPIGEPGSGEPVVGYVRYSMALQDPVSIATQKRIISKYAADKKWVIVHWYEEPEESAKYERIEQRPVFAQLLAHAGKDFAGVLCYSTDRWARNVGVTHTSLDMLRRRQVWWASIDDRWDIDKIKEPGSAENFTITVQKHESYLIDLSRRTAAGKEERALNGYHNGNPTFGYLPPEYPKAPDGAPSTWRPPRMPARSDPVNFPALQRMGELVADGVSDAQIAEILKEHVSVTARFGERALSKDTIAAIRRSWFPREFAPGSGHGTIETPSGELVEGLHPAAWSYDLWQRMDAAQFERRERWKGRTESRVRVNEFSRLLVCSGCRRPLRVQPYDETHVYYRDTSQIRNLSCPTPGNLSVRSDMVVGQVAALLSSLILPTGWRELVATECRQVHDRDVQVQLKTRRDELQAEQQRIVLAFRKGYLSESALDDQIEQIRSELLTLPMPVVEDIDERISAALLAGEALPEMVEAWPLAAAEERRDILWALIRAEGLIYDLERCTLVGILPQPDVLPVLTLALAPRWERLEDGLWLPQEYWPPLYERAETNRPPLTEPKLNAEQQEQALAMLQVGMSLREVASHFPGVSYSAIWRLKQRTRTQDATTHLDASSNFKEIVETNEIRDA